MLESVKNSMIIAYCKELDLFLERFLKFSIEEKSIKFIKMMKFTSAINFCDHRKILGIDKKIPSHDFYIGLNFEHPNHRTLNLFHISIEGNSYEYCLNQFMKEYVDNLKKHVDYFIHDSGYLYTIECLVK